jgi:hypothetical protein
MNKIKSIVEELANRASSLWGWLAFGAAIILFLLITCCEKKNSDGDKTVI